MVVAITAIVTKCQIVASTTRALVVVFQPFYDAGLMEVMLTFWIVGKGDFVTIFIVN
jgi:hypothetical protein